MLDKRFSQKIVQFMR